MTFTYRKSGSNHWRQMTLDAMEFIRRFLEHVLPSGFHKERHYGFFCPNNSVTIEAVRWLVTLHNGEVFALLAVATQVPLPKPAVRCACCGGPLRIVAVSPPRIPFRFDSS